MVTEEWRIIDDFPNYMISNFGNIKRISRTMSRKGFPYTLPEKILKSYNSFSSYNMIKLHNKEGFKSYLIHRLVAKAFIDNPRCLPFVNHIDGNKLNNNVNNLEWVDHRENSCHNKQLKNISSSKFTGVSLQTKSQKWYACIRINAKTINLGYYNSELEAYEARRKFESVAGIVNKYL